ncbi:uncharacterized protein PHACADRAFT_264804 [Phanerochaete carnosa HHB-10118-sp]|uniref:DUF590-domain-containing protein n=1 Tax=Phanerochaete carnosa (strain HHB-10118-sp) TaxID=650164 RepID=K5VTT2_PHACS|nr:uncharacterized protein PHACADRAFT_264804 [Phanerochaete carnosa HHB-10118-sp]EKM50205.1 hypothetical protein PHACADRAFT_264804 [Phanerochaete carnosa HHB-10118-sp]
MAPKVDLVIVFRSSSRKIEPKVLARQNTKRASEQYEKLLQTLARSGLLAVGKRGERDGQLLVMVSCPPALLKRLAQRERHSDFLNGLPSRHSIGGEDVDANPLSPADQIRLVHTYITTMQADGGLGIAPVSAQWDRVESIMALHDHLFNDTWIRSWTTRQLGLVSSSKIREQFGEAVALYFAFLAYYTKFLIFISVASVLFYFFAAPYSTLYSSVLLVWSVAFVEWWRIKQRILAIRWGTKGSFRVEKRRAHYVPIAWWRRELRILFSLPVILFFAAILACLLTGIFVFEAFVTQLYKGPGAQIMSFAPTVLFLLLVPRVLAIYHTYAVRLTDWENHGRQSTHDASLTIKTFSLSAIVAYGGLALSAFVYVPFGEEVMTWVQVYLFHTETPMHAKAKTWATTMLSSLSAASPTASAMADAGKRAYNATAGPHLWEMDGSSARSKLNPKRLQEQMYAITVINQVVNNFLEVGLPYVTRAVDSFRAGKGLTLANNSAGAKKKRVQFEDEANGSTEIAKSITDAEDREFLERVRREAALPEYSLFTDYSEMVTQFGYVSLWSTIWPLAPVMSLINNWLELRSDAFKIAVHTRRPIPARTDTIGPWLDTLTFLTWLAALTNSALVYLFRPTDHCKAVGTTLQHHHHHFSDANSSTRQLLTSAAVIALAASHGYLVLSMFVRHILERLMWKGSKEEQAAERLEAQIKQQYLRSIGVADVATGDLADSKVLRQNEVPQEEQAFWAEDEGLEELSKGVKDA